MAGLQRPPQQRERAARRRRDVGPRAARRLLRLSARASDDDREQPDEAGQLLVGRARARRTAATSRRSTRSLAGRAGVGRGARAVLELEAGGLGDQLPSGVVRVYARDARGQPQFVGEDRIGHTSAGSDLALKIGDAFDVTIQPTLRQTTRASRRATDYDMSYVVRNARSEPITVTIRQDNLWRFNEVVDAVDRGPAHGRRQLRLGRARAGERRDRAHVHGSPKLVSAPRTTLRAGGRCSRRCRRARRTRSRSYLAARRFRRRDDLPRRSRAGHRDADRRSAGRRRDARHRGRRRDAVAAIRDHHGLRRARSPKATSTSTG